jgi:hypothetical protein
VDPDAPSSDPPRDPCADLALESDSSADSWADAASFACDLPAVPSADAEAPASDRPAEPFADTVPSEPGAGTETPGSDAPADPFTDADALEELGDEIATLAAHIHAATHRMLVLIADFDRRRGWELGGYPSCAHWLAARTGIDRATAREKVRAARALVGLPQTSAAMARGELSFSKVRALTRVATPDNETELLELGRGCTTAQIERMVRGWRLGSRADEAEREAARHRNRSVSIRPGDDGMYVIHGRLTPEVGALLMRAIEAASDALFREQGWRPADDPTAQERAAQRRADALGLLAERAMAVGFGRRGGAVVGERAIVGGGAAGEGAAGEGAAGEGAAGEGAAGEGAAGDGATEGEDDTVPISGTRAERYQVVLHVDVDTLATCCETEGEGAGASVAESVAGDAEGGAVCDERADARRVRRGRIRSRRSAPRRGRSELDDGTGVSAETSRRLSCDCGLVVMTHDRLGSILDVGRKTRTIPPALRRALEARDRGCRFPGCGLRFTDGHHIRHWGDGGETSLANCALLCRHHHRLVHEGGWRMDWWGEGRAVFFSPSGGTHFDGAWEPPVLPADPTAELVEHHQRAGLRPGPLTASARWERESDIPRSVLFAAMEAVDGG